MPPVGLRCCRPERQLKKNMRDFTILFDQAEPATLEHPAYKRYGPLGFPALPARRPWIYSNFVQSLDGVASYKGVNATGAHISQSAEDRWLVPLKGRLAS